MKIRISESIFDSIDPRQIKFVRIVVLTIITKVFDAIKKGEPLALQKFRML